MVTQATYNVVLTLFYFYLSVYYTDQITSDFCKLDVDDSMYFAPSIYIGVLVRNKAHTLPYFLHGLESQIYPKHRVKIEFRLDNSIDDSELLLSKWIELFKHEYHSVILVNSTHKLCTDSSTCLWNTDHYKHVIHLRQTLLNNARNAWADFYLSIDADVMLINPFTFKHLIRQFNNPVSMGQSISNGILAVLAPMLNCTNSEYYSNFWGSMTEAGYYKRSDNYIDIKHGHVKGVFPVAMVHTIFLINLRLKNIARLNYDPPPEGYQGPIDDMIIFAHSMKHTGLNFFIDNLELFGFITKPVENNDVEQNEHFWQNYLTHDRELSVHLRTQAIIDLNDTQSVKPSQCLTEFVQRHLPVRSKLGFDEIYCINLLRRPDRFRKMDYIFSQLGIDAKYVPAVDGKQLDDDVLKKLEIRQLSGYTDPYYKRSLKYGEIGCFLSHYNLWNEMIEKDYKRIMILEDDLRFNAEFVKLLKNVLDEADTVVGHWDLLYIGRKRMSKDEKRVPHTSYLVYPDYTYWTLGYILNQSGAHKLLNQKPLSKMVAIDEYLPIMFNRHPRKEWLDNFHPRDLITLSAEPLLVEPQHYTGEKFYVSDTENSDIFVH